MALSTTINREYALRFIGVSALLFAFGVWFLYDGIKGYPEENAAVAPIAERLAQEERTAADWMNAAQSGTTPLAEAFAKEGMKVPAKIADTFASWISIDDPKKDDVEMARSVLRTPPHSADDIRNQFVAMAISFIVAFLLEGIVALRFVTRFTLEDDTLTVAILNTAKRYPIDTLQSVDDSQWKTRGILKLTFTAGAVKLDAWHHKGIKPIAERFLPQSPTPAA